MNVDAADWGISGDTRSIRHSTTSSFVILRLSRGQTGAISVV